MRHQCVRFPAYTRPQLAGIVLQRLRRALDTHGIDTQQQGSDAVVEDILLTITTNMQPASASSGINPESIREGVLTAVVHSVRDSLITCFTTVLNVALPLLTSVFTHPIVLYEASISCFVALYGATPNELLRNITLQYLLVISKLDTIDCRGFTVDSKVLAGICTEFLPLASLERVRAAVTLTHHLPTYSFDAVEVAKLGKRKGVQLSRPSLSATTAAGGGGSSEGVRSARLPSQLEALDTNTSEFSASLSLTACTACALVCSSGLLAYLALCYLCVLLIPSFLLICNLFFYSSILSCQCACGAGAGSARSECAT